jgi:hypothetical protein
MCNHAIKEKMEKNNLPENKEVIERSDKIKAENPIMPNEASPNADEDQEEDANIDLEIYDLGHRFNEMCKATGQPPEEVLKEIAVHWHKQQETTPVIIPHEEDIREFPRPKNSLFKFL